MRGIFGWRRLASAVFKSVTNVLVFLLTGDTEFSAWSRDTRWGAANPSWKRHTCTMHRARHRSGRMCIAVIVTQRGVTRGQPRSGRLQRSSTLLRVCQATHASSPRDRGSIPRTMVPSAATRRLRYSSRLPRPLTVPRCAADALSLALLPAAVSAV